MSLASCAEPFMLSLALRFFFFNDPATTEIYTLSLHYALPISASAPQQYAISYLTGGIIDDIRNGRVEITGRAADGSVIASRSEEHTSELQSQSNLVCRLLLEKKNQ